MELSVREAATLMGRSPRTVRAQVARGELPGVKRNGQWKIQRRHLPLTEAQHQALQDKAQTIRDAVETALPSRLARHAADRTKSILDLDAFRAGVSVLQRMRACSDTTLSDDTRRRVGERIEGALLALSEAVLQFDRQVKLDALHRSRARVAHAIAFLLMDSEIPPREPVLGWVCQLENEVAAGIGGLARWVDRLRGKRS